MGDSGEQSQVGGKWRAPALEHITLYVQSRFLYEAVDGVGYLFLALIELETGESAAGWGGEF